MQGGHLIVPRTVGPGWQELTTTTDTEFCTGYPGLRALEERLNRCASGTGSGGHVKYSYETASVGCLMAPEASEP